LGRYPIHFHLAGDLPGAAAAFARAQAAELRRKILALLPHMETRLVLDFEGVTVAASSLMDELLGRLADELGEGTFRDRIQIVNMSPLVASIANVVLEQRLNARDASQRP